MCLLSAVSHLQVLKVPLIQELQMGPSARRPREAQWVLVALEILDFL